MLQNSAAAFPVLDERPAPAPSPERLRLAVGIATSGRANVLAETLERLSRQRRRPDRIVVCGPSPADVEGITEAHPGVQLVSGRRGVACQRNLILGQVQDFDVLVFFDDDFVPCEDYLQSVERTMLENPDVVMLTGVVLKDGITGPGITFEAADAAVGEALLTAPSGALERAYNAYGCNMSLRLAPVQRHGLTFDERLPLYGWLEDVDFSRRLVRFGRIVRAYTARGVHLGTKRGRQSGFRLGYSQVANPYYLMRKGTLNWHRGLFQMSCNIAKNVVRSFWPESWIDRRGRLYGNVYAFGDLALGRIDPRRIETF